MKQPASLVFVCQNLRDPDNPKGSCMRRGSKAVLDRMKAVREELGLKAECRVMGATCLGSCESGVTVLCVDSREGATYYGRMDPALGEALIRERVAGPGAGVHPAHPELTRHRLDPANLLDLSGLETTEP
jgi:predicted metal-binding protein